MVGNYTLQRTIGQGTYGRVRMATHRLTNSRVAVKQIPKQHVASLTREIHHHRRLHHPHVLQLFEVIQTESYIWMILELCAGGELYDYVISRGKLSEMEACSMFGQICLGLAYIHDQGIVHRDLKLENILLDENHNIKLSDFGFTREYQPHQLLQTKCGTIAYSAPEVLGEGRYFGPEIDVWSMGVILYVLLCGYLPFDDENDYKMQWKIIHEDVDIPATLSDEARDLLIRMLQKDGSRRPTIREILSHPWFQTSSTKYLHMLSAPRLALFTSPAEQELFASLQDLGFAVGQIRHSVTTFACDATGAFWWLLLRKRAQKAEEHQTTSLSPSSAPPAPALGLVLSPCSVASSTELEPRVPVPHQALYPPHSWGPSEYGTSPLSHGPYATLASLAPVAVASPNDSLASTSTVKQPFLPAKLGMTQERQTSSSLFTPMLRRMSSVSSRASTAEHSTRSFSRSFSRRLSSGSLESYSMASSGHLRRQVSNLSTNTPRRRRDSESTVLKYRYPTSRSRTPNAYASHTSSRSFHERPMSLDEQALKELHQQYHTPSHSRSSTPPSGVSSVIFARGSRSAFAFHKRATPPPEPRTRVPLPRKDQQVDPADLLRMRKSLVLSDEDDWIDEDEFVGGLGQRGSLTLEAPWHPTRGGSPCPPRMQYPRSTSSSETKPLPSENTKSIRQKVQRDLHGPLIEEDEEF